MSMPESMRRGLRGEQLTARFLRERGYVILTANYLTPLGETDIIALSPEKILCFIEVKTRSPGGMFPPAEAVDKAKEERLISNALIFAKKFPDPFDKIRFDIAQVILSDLYTADIQIIENAFGQDYYANWKK